jgi:hypothetical protein
MKKRKFMGQSLNGCAKQRKKTGFFPHRSGSGRQKAK